VLRTSSDPPPPPPRAHFAQLNVDGREEAIRVGPADDSHDAAAPFCARHALSAHDCGRLAEALGERHSETGLTARRRR
jgi:hypothetical protein